MWQPLRSPRTSVGMSQRRTAGVLKLVKECLGMSRDESSYRSVRDVMRLISKFESRLAGRSTTQSNNCVKEFYSSNKRTDENYKSIAWNNTNLRKELRVILQPKVVDVLLKNDYEHIPPRQFRCSPSTLLLQRGYYLYRGRQYEEACGFFDLAVARDSREATRDLDRALDLTLREKVVLHEARNTIREQQRQKVELAIRFNRSVARANMGDDDGALQDLESLLLLHVGCAQAPPLQLCANRPLSLATFPNEQGLIISTQKLQGRFRKTPEFASLTSGVQVALATDPALRSPIELQQLSDMLSTLHVFQGISPHCMAQLAASVSYRPLKLRDTALTCNAETDACFIVLNVAHKDVCYQQQTNAALSETYQAEAPSELLVIPRQVFDATLRNIAYQNLQRRFSFLRRSGLFESWPTREVAKIAGLSRERRLSPNSAFVLTRQGDSPEYVFLLITGICRVVRSPDVHAEKLSNYCILSTTRCATEHSFHTIKTRDNLKTHFPTGAMLQQSQSIDCCN
ncbi:hypothetical protein AURANDRAFT_72856 [Aureococcus anophagefferens]|uniref:Cyclic nucleotide-binding domain-containing protein n=1 Tax=Aureococcus anophagefferens TaxID=44056 RepID=F0YR67_AURAN|nr:hypothetical protein AURANDRAFT_72856 [Aureococcus anophagefferens]EGB02393.1 hypothetical protein AURANDRAFT_72856 [Aureococcus anophagefferens]|eukprot:XP_009042910.1 hypothetical protein AURANDRAFT_72856 [Aureococcus anophagefferens]